MEIWYVKTEMAHAASFVLYWWNKFSSYRTILIHIRLKHFFAHTGVYVYILTGVYMYINKRPNKKAAGLRQSAAASIAGIKGYCFT